MYSNFLDYSRSKKYYKKHKNNMGIFKPMKPSLFNKLMDKRYIRSTHTYHGISINCVQNINMCFFVKRKSDGLIIVIASDKTKYGNDIWTLITINHNSSYKVSLPSKLLCNDNIDVVIKDDWYSTLLSSIHETYRALAEYDLANRKQIPDWKMDRICERGAHELLPKPDANLNHHFWVNRLLSQ